MANIYCLMHARNQRSVGSIVKAYYDSKRCESALKELTECLQAVRIRKRGAIVKPDIEDIKERFSILHPEFDFNLNRTMNDIYWVEEVEIV